MWEAMIEVHGGQACEICGTSAGRPAWRAGPAPDPAYTRQ